MRLNRKYAAVLVTPGGGTLGLGIRVQTGRSLDTGEDWATGMRKYTPPREICPAPRAIFLVNVDQPPRVRWLGMPHEQRGRTLFTSYIAYVYLGRLKRATDVQMVPFCSPWAWGRVPLLLPQLSPWQPPRLEPNDPARKVARGCEKNNEGVVLCIFLAHAKLSDPKLRLQRRSERGQHFKMCVPSPLL